MSDTSSPPTTKSRPFTFAAESVHRYTTSGATISGASASIWDTACSAPVSLSLSPPPRREARARCIASRSSGERVSRVPARGRMAFAVTPYRPRSRASVRVSPTMPSLAAA